MTTPTGLAMWGQAGAYNGIDDRAVIRAVTGGRTGLCSIPTVQAGSGLNLTLKGGWLAVADCGDGTSLVVGSRTDQTVTGLAGPPTGTRTDYLWCDIQPDSATWTLSVINSTAASGRTGLPVATLTVPANATLASQFTIAPNVAGLEKRLLATVATNDTSTRTATAWSGATTLITAVATMLPGHYYRVRTRADAFMAVGSGGQAARAGIGYRAAGAADSTSALQRSTCIQFPDVNQPSGIECEYLFGYPVASAVVQRQFDGRWWVGAGSYKVSGRTDGGAAISMSIEDLGM
jgi:hypothetical protein